MKTNPEIFKAYDIRGVYYKDLYDETAYLLGHAFAKMRAEETGKEKFTVVVAEDMRLSSPQLKKELIKGLTDAGIDVVDIGLASTPTFYFAVANFGHSGGLIVSASHNPPEYNGFKITREKAVPVSGDTGMNTLRDLVMAGDFKNAEKPGNVTKKDNILEAQLKHDLAFGNPQNIKPIKISIDTANGMGAQYVDILFAGLPNKLVKMNFKLDGTFPAHEADPLKEKNMEDLKKKVIDTHSDLGISTDGDGDRIFFVDETGNTIEPGIIRAILSKLFLQEKPGSKIAYDIRPGKITLDTILKNGGTPIVTKVGHSLIKEQAIKEGAFFAGESSGHFFLNMDIGCFEVPMIVILKLLEEFSRFPGTVSEYIKPYQKYFHSGEINNIVNDKELVFSNLLQKYSNAKISRLDGVTIEYENYWFNVRGSNTEPKIRLNLEATTRKLMEQKRDEVLSIIKS